MSITIEKKELDELFEDANNTKDALESYVRIVGREATPHVIMRALSHSMNVKGAIEEILEREILEREEL